MIQPYNHAQNLKYSSYSYFYYWVDAYLYDKSVQIGFCLNPTFDSVLFNCLFSLGSISKCNPTFGDGFVRIR